jgi:hypothetical protein
LSLLVDFVFRNSIDIVQQMGPLPSQYKLAEFVGILGVPYFPDIEEPCEQCGQALLRNGAGVTCPGNHAPDLEKIPGGEGAQILQTRPKTSRAALFKRHFANARRRNRRKLFIIESL